MINLFGGRHGTGALTEEKDGRKDHEEDVEPAGASLATSLHNKGVDKDNACNGSNQTE